MKELQDFIEISKYAGERFDLIQAGGGNSSVKNDDGTMYIKASGIYLSEVSNDYGYSIVDNNEILNFINNKDLYENQEKSSQYKIASEYIAKFNKTPDFKPSIETLMHSLLKKHTLHTHPIVVNAITCRKNWKEILTELFGNDIFCIDYKTPGIELALEIKQNLKNKNSIIFLQNHGLIITSDKKEDIKNLTEFVIEKIEKYLNVNMGKYKLTNEVSNFFDNRYISYLSDDIYLNKMLSSPFIYSLPFCPDKMVYCGVKALLLGENPKQDIKNYEKTYFDIPKVVIYKKHLFFIAKNVKKAKEIEDVFKFHIFSLSIDKNTNINYLSSKEIEYIGNWEAEKFRKEK